MLRCTAALSLLTLMLFAAPVPSFEVVSIKPNNSGSGNSSVSTHPGHYTATNISAAFVLQQAFGVRPFQIVNGPGWLSDNYDIAGTTGVAKDMKELELRPYLESMLEERFGLRYHRETREMPVYSLVIAKGGGIKGITLHEGAASNSGVNDSNSSGKSAVTFTNVTMEGLAVMLGRHLDRAVLDNTGLPGSYDFKLEWAPEPSAENPGPSIFAALQEQLGLKLESTKGPVEFIVIDHIEKPSEN